jgi:hypothetical protein
VSWQDAIRIVLIAIPTVIYTLILFYLVIGELTAPWRARREHKRLLREIQGRGR